ncbi:sensor histidine kinase [Streptomyces spectabilis]|uniref:histidine kinase n=1 Tax=Streptomyces spectabilis TaxID=68270 RepID=A0A5P2XEE2_STRST|nr:nitrate- and nitrite sensing domain-containing protein [Streptomyces spectabilis]MBB5104571.1 signal transduction histidine kinase [Streptomyces spectabilis]MCI3905074.1 nitrate- and nitrite sensing domain-containing protein [Streptomyces spectabilis]QEV62094.1 HAMP domain-containing protein [Streptomyces spectabilis]
MRPRREGSQQAPGRARPGATPPSGPSGQGTGAAGREGRAETPVDAAHDGSRAATDTAPTDTAATDTAATDTPLARADAPAEPEHPTGAPEQPVPPQAAPTPPKARVRNRLIVAVAVVAAAVAGAGAPAIIAASEDLNDSQSLVTLSELTQQAITLSHSLADERDEVTAYIAAGRPEGKGLSESRSARVDRRIEELREAAADANTNSSVTAGLRSDLAELATVRRSALTGRSSALDAHKAYAKAIGELHALTRELAEKLPPRAGSGAYALADLDHAVDQAGATRGLLLAALSVPRPAATGTTVDPVTGLPTSEADEADAEAGRRDDLSAAAQQAHVRELAALADFQEAAPARAGATYETTVTGSDVTTAEQYLDRLTDERELSAADQRLDRDKVNTALSARIEAMRGAESALATARTKSLAELRDDDVTALEIRVGLVGALLLLAVGVAMATARSLTRPLAVLRLGAARVAAEPGTAEPVRFTGRDDEFAAVVRSVNALHGHAIALQERLGTLEADRKHLIGRRQTMADARQAMADERDALRAELADAATNLDRVRRGIQGTFVNLALRTLGLVERQLAVIENLEEREQDPDRLATLFKLDHLATVTRRHSENLLVLAGADHGHQHAGPVPLVDVVRAAVSEIERYERVRIATLPPHSHIAGFAADDISHLVAELLENATSFSPPDSSVEVAGWLLENGEVMLSVQDDGIGASVERLRELNARLAEYSAFSPEDAYEHESGDELGLGLYVVARLAARHGARVRLREQKQGGVAAVVVLPDGILTEPPAAVAPRPEPSPVELPAAEPTPAVPAARDGSEAEADSRVLPTRSGERDPLIAAAETTMELLVPTLGADHPDEHREPAPHALPDEDVPEADTPPEAGPQVFTAKGLPKRTPRVSPIAGGLAPRTRPAGVDAEELRRRLGGFQQGARSGRRDVAAELAGQAARGPGPAGAVDTAGTADVPGDPVEEASS